MERFETAVKVKTLSPVEMEWYIQTGEPFDKAGGYAIQGIGSFMIESIHGSYTNVVGLPLCELIQMLNRLGAIISLPIAPECVDSAPCIQWCMADEDDNPQS